MCLCASMCVYVRECYLSVWELVVPDVKSSLSVQCSHQKRMEVYLGSKNRLGLGLQHSTVYSTLYVEVSVCILFPSAVLFHFFTFQFFRIQLKY